MKEVEAKNFLIHTIRGNLLRQMRRVDETEVTGFAQSWWEACKDFAIYSVTDWEWCFKNVETRKGGIVRCSDFLAELEVYRPKKEAGKGINYTPATSGFGKLVMQIASSVMKGINPPPLPDWFVMEFRGDMNNMDKETLIWWRNVYSCFEA
jgi:hypothetical protein